MKIKTASMFFEIDSGNYKCYYCGQNCSDKFTSKEYVKKTFSNRDMVKHPASIYVCKGCVTMFQEKGEIRLIDGEERKGTKLRGYSWILTRESCTAATKKHIKELREFALNPPEPPFCLVLSDSGQKHILFRSKVAHSQKLFPITLEEDIIMCDKNVFKEYLDIIKPLVAVVGKMAFPLNNVNQFIKILKYYGEERGGEYLEKYDKINNKKLIKLVIWLSPNMENCKNEYRSIDT